VRDRGRSSVEIASGGVLVRRWKRPCQLVELVTRARKVVCLEACICQVGHPFHRKDHGECNNGFFVWV
jgi:hypothetical protein